MAREKGSFSFSGNLEVAKKGALDARTFCPTYADLLAFTSANFIYNGHLVSVWDTDVSKRGLYRCINENDLSNAASWQKVGDDIDLSAVEKTVNKNSPNGYAGLDGSGLIPATILPSYVDDVIEKANLAAMPTPGETGKIYVALDSNKTYRWSGSAYIEISPSPGSSDAVIEGSSNLYFTQARAVATPLTGLTATTGTPTASDSILSGFGKIVNFVNNIATTIRGTVLTGFTSASTAVTAADTVLSATGKLQGQVTNLQSNIPTTTEMQTGTDNTKFATPSRITSWWTWVKTQAQIFSSKVTAAVIRHAPQSATPATLENGDIWLESTNNRLRMQKGTQTVDVLSSADNYLFVGANPRLVQTNALGDLSATQEIAEGFVTDTDITGAITAATYNVANNYTANVTPLNNKTLFQGQWYKNNSDLFFATDDNTCFKVGKASDSTLYIAYTDVATSSTNETQAYSYILPANTLSANGQSIEFEFLSALSNSYYDKTIKLYWGNNVVATASIINSLMPKSNVLIKGKIIRSGQSAIRVSYNYVVETDDGGGNPRSIVNASAIDITGVNFTVSNNITTTMQAGNASANEIVAKTFALTHKTV
ncbi:hypothetical protein SAMN05421788_101843 [Filimonas lacunae]|uniref:Uncharacterized protein n=1 Tax=Filimonas lacunae TaxID=477680 RepID=A0A173MPL9_9BACT|nr:hypothetical protein [Filimonas lacunae]BAV09407.1 phage tail fiber protein [Filimonas lacunae]SIS72580.1 hypothetical protein SAMN05421788_101843 [Filimonas lacunae]